MCERSLKRRKVLYLTSETYPYGKAYASRVRAIVKMLNYSGCSVTVLCDQISDSGSYSDECTYYEAIPNKLSGISKFLKLPTIYCNKVEELLENDKYDIVIARSMFDRHNRLLSAVKRHNIPFILESCECYDKKSFGNQLMNVRYYQFRYCWNHSYNKVDAIIAISRYIEDHYKRIGLKTFRLPAILDTTTINFQKGFIRRYPVKLIYSGDITGKKELLDEIILAISGIDHDGSVIEFNIYGPSKESVFNTLSNRSLDYIRNTSNIKIHGRIPQNQIYAKIAESDLGIFIRPNRVSSNAGFPTKLGEYLAMGLPVIANDTGDISLVLKSSYNGFLLNGNTSCEIEAALRAYLNMKDSEVETMKENARISAEKWFDPKGYYKSMDKFLNDVSSNFQIKGSRI